MAPLVRQIQGSYQLDRVHHGITLSFGPTEYENPSEALTRLKHTTTVSAYQEEFDKLSQLIDALPDNHLIGIFIAGLKDEVRLDVKLKNPCTLSDSHRRRSTRRGTQQPPKEAYFYCQSPRTTTPLKNTPVAETSPPFKRITNQEAYNRQENGLCFYCDEKYKPGHRCNKPQLFMIEYYPLLKPYVEPYTEPPPLEPDPNFYP